MKKNHADNSPYHLPKLAWLLIAATILTAPSCTSDYTPPTPEPTRHSPTPTPSPSPHWEEREEPDDVTITAPDGWVLLTEEDRERQPNLMVSSSHDFSTLEGIIISNRPPSIAHMHGPDADLKAERDSFMKYSTEVGRTKNAIPIGPKQIAGTQAWGYSGEFTFNDKKTYPSQHWLLWREDGLWYIYVTGFENTNTVPEELITALDTIQFTQTKPPKRRR